MRKPNKTIFLLRSTRSKFGGAERYLSRLATELSKYQIDHQLIHSPLPKFLPSWLRVLLFNLWVCVRKKNKFYFSLDRVTCPDIYRAGDGVHKVFLSVEKKSKTNLLHPVYLFMERRCFHKAKRIIANSQMVKQQIIDTYRIQPDKVKVVYNGIQSKENDYKKSFNSLSREFSIARDQNVILYVGSGFKRKGVEEFLEIVSNLKTPNIKAFVVGKEKQLELYVELVKQLQIDDKVVFTGAREDVDDFYVISDIFLFPTHYEPFSNVVLEAMNFKNVVFTTSQNGASEILDGAFVMDSPTDMSVPNKIDTLFSDKDKLEKIQLENRALSKQFSIEKNLKDTIEIINECV